MNSNITELLGNRDLGASALLARFGEKLAGFSDTEIFDNLVMLKNSFPLMAVWPFAENYLKKHKPGPHTFKRFVKKINKDKTKVIARACNQIPHHDTYLTLSRSSLVETFLKERNKHSKVNVVCSMSLPANEGLTLNSSLQAAGVKSFCVPDWDLELELANVDVVLLGADWVTDRFIINKQGSRQLVEAATRMDVPVFILAETFKYMDLPIIPEQDFFQDWSSGKICRYIKVFEVLPLTESINLIRV